MADSQKKLFDLTDRFETKLVLVELVSGWKRELRIRLKGFDVTSRHPSGRARKESASMPIKAPEELSDFVCQLSAFLGDPSQEKCSFSLGSHGRGCGMLVREGGEPTTWLGLKGGYSRYGFHVDELALRELLHAASDYE